MTNEVGMSGKPRPTDADKSVWVKELTLKNFLSFGPTSDPVTLRALNVLVGPNGSGKSNFIEAFSILRSAPDDIRRPFRDGGGVSDWIYKGVRSESAQLNAIVKGPRRAKISTQAGRFGTSTKDLRYSIAFTEVRQRLVISLELVERLSTVRGQPASDLLFENSADGLRAKRADAEDLEDVEIDDNSSVLSQLREPAGYRDITHLAKRFEAIRLYRDWRFGPHSSLRTAQKPDAPNDFLSEDYSNLFLVLNQMEADVQVEEKLLERIRDLIPGVRRLRFNVESGSILLYLVEGEFQIPATRLSDGTLRWLCLLAILLHPNPPPLVVIEEPELGIHPDLLPTLADLLLEASGRMQLVVTTHSDILIDALSETPESILVADKVDGQTTLTRLNAEELKPWLEKYRLGALWIEGHIGGKRW